MIKKFDKLKLLKNICDAYDYDLKVEGKNITCINNDDDESEVNKYNNIDLALIDWLDTLIESEIQYILDNVNISWRNEINYIKNIKVELMYNENSTSIDDTLAYGSIPENIKKNISVYLDEKIKRTEEFINLTKNKNFSFKSYKVSLPTEFVIKDGKLTYIKIPNKYFLERTLLQGCDAEIEFGEMDTYDKNGLIEYMPLTPIESVTKFILNIPVAITISNNYIRIQNPINYLYLF